jgi:hypothetical protein
MKEEKLKLQDLSIKSFITNVEYPSRLEGGFSLNGTCVPGCISDNCEYSVPVICGADPSSPFIICE